MWLTGMCKIQAEPPVVFNLVPGQDLRSSVFQVNATPVRAESLLAVSSPKVVIWDRIKKVVSVCGKGKQQLTYSSSISCGN